MRWVDGHCDVLSKMWSAKSPLSFYRRDSNLDVTWPLMEQAEVGLQVFALFVPPEVPGGATWQAALAQVDHFYESVVGDGSRMVPIRSQRELAALERTGKVGGLLSLEGAEALQGDLVHLRLLYRLGLRQVGLTWNGANEAADGIEEERGGGLTRFGRRLAAEMQRLSMILDVSHLSVRGFWEVIEWTGLPVIASHSNCRSLCSHVRNLDDRQIRALIQREGRMGITFVPKFVTDDPDRATVEGVLRHVEHVCSLGGEEILTFGSDFDGTDRKIPGLEHTGHLDRLWEALIKRYPETLVKRWTTNNWLHFYSKHLPSGGGFPPRQTDDSGI
ncbi:dipeptidase [Salinithrix halophila]|uniref:Dipeptidase n=1 Tax=Salinithrix halophila TaxID=1485204 RepID=A0ABV8JL36_9BACL